MTAADNTVIVITGASSGFGAADRIRRDFLARVGLDDLLTIAGQPGGPATIAHRGVPHS